MCGCNDACLVGTRNYGCRFQISTFLAVLDHAHLAQPQLVNELLHPTLPGSTRERGWQPQSGVVSAETASRCVCSASLGATGFASNEHGLHLVNQVNESRLMSRHS